MSIHFGGDGQTLEQHNIIQKVAGEKNDKILSSVRPTAAKATIGRKFLLS